MEATVIAGRACSPQGRVVLKAGSGRSRVAAQIPGMYASPWSNMKQTP